MFVTGLIIGLLAGVAIGLQYGGRRAIRILARRYQQDLISRVED